MSRAAAPSASAASPSRFSSDRKSSLGLTVAAQAVESQPEVVAHARTPGHEPRRRAERLGRLAQPLLFREQEPERVVELALVGRALDPLAQHPLGIRVASHRVVERDEIGARRTEVRIHAERRQVLTLRELALPLSSKEYGQVEVARGHVGHRHLCLDELSDRRVQRLALRGVEVLRGHPLGRRHRLEPGDGGEADGWVAVTHEGGHGAGALGAVATEKAERAGADDGGQLAIEGDGDEGRSAVPRSRASRGHGRRPVRPLRARGPVPLDHGRGGPLGRAVAVTGDARVGSPDLHREIRARRAERVVAPRVHDHVVLGGHVAVDALGAGRGRLVEVMRRRVIGPGRERREARVRLGPVTLGADGIALGPGLAAVRVVAIGAADTALVHLALTERPVLVDLVELLAVGVVEARAQRLGSQRVVERPARMLAGGDAAPARMARCAAVHLVGRTAGRRIAGLEADREPARRPPTPLARPRDVVAAGAVAGLAADVELAPGRVVPVGLRVVALLEVRRVAFGAHQVPVLVAPRPVQRIVGRDLLARVEREPVLPAGIPRDGQALQPPAGELDQVLLERRHAEGVLDLEVGRLAVRAFGVDEVLALSLEEARHGTGLAESHVPEIAEDGLVRGGLHGALVMRAEPFPRLLCMALGARAVADVREHLGLGRHVQLRTREQLPGQAGGRRQDEHGRHANQEAPPAWRRRGRWAQPTCSSSAKRKRARARAIATGPRMIPMAPKVASPPMRPRSTGRVEIWARPETTSGRTMLSTSDTTTRPQKVRKRAAPTRSCATCTNAAGTQTRDEPTTGTSAASEARTPKTTGDGRPVNAKLRPTSIPCTTAVRSVPRATARITAEGCPTRSALRAAVSGTRASARVIISPPSRRKKNSRKSVRPTSTTTPSTPAKKAPLEAMRSASIARPPSRAHAWICSGGTGTNFPIHVKSWSKAGTWKTSAAWVIR